VLRFLVAVTTDAALRKWATDELRIVNAEAEKYKKQVEQLKLDLAERNATIADLKTQNANVLDENTKLAQAKHTELNTRLQAAIKAREAKREELRILSAPILVPMRSPDE
jgi:hypothetical protein